MRKASIIALVLAVICIGITGWQRYQMQIGEHDVLEAVAYAHEGVGRKDWAGAKGNIEAAFAAQETMRHAAKEFFLWFDLTAVAVVSALVTGLLASKNLPNQPLQGTPAESSSSSTEPDGRRS